MRKNRIFTKRRLLILMGALIFSVAIVSAVTMIATHTCLIYECPISWVRLPYPFIISRFQVVHDFLALTLGPQVDRLGPILIWIRCMMDTVCLV